MSAYQFTPVDAPARPDVMDAALKLLTALSDPKQAKLNLEKHAANAKREAQLDEREEALERREAIVAAKLDSLDEDVAKRRNEAERQVADRERDADERLTARERDLVAREKAIEEARERNIKLHDDLSDRLRRIRDAAT